jgi:N-methylhydantoinase A/oxoprolinase/acetone carboxylase beta subunit
VPTVPASSALRVGIDIAGTFTDLVLRLPDGSLRLSKAPPTPDDPGRAVVEGPWTQDYEDRDDFLERWPREQLDDSQ